MRNLKHSFVAVIAVAMISSMAVAQSADIRNSKYIAAGINSGTANNSINIAVEENKEEYDIQKEIETNPEAATKVNLETAYVSLSNGSLNVRQSPSTESAVSDQLEACEEVSVLSSSEGWCEVSYDGGKTGYVSAEALTTDKSTAEYNAKNYDNYKKALVQTFGSTLRVRSAASKDSDVITELDDTTPVVALWTEGDFIKVAYGDNYDEGYVINTGIDLTGEWVAKSTVANKQAEVAEAKAAAERARVKDIEKSDAKSRTSASNSDDSVSAAPASSKGQAIVNTAMKYLGIPYVWGGTSPSGFDCSGLVQYVCNKNGIRVNRVAADQIGCGTRVSKGNLQPGDLVFFGPGSIHHVGIYIGNGKMIHAPQTGDVVKISSISSGYYLSQYAGATRVY